MPPWRLQALMSTVFAQVAWSKRYSSVADASKPEPTNASHKPCPASSLATQPASTSSTPTIHIESPLGCDAHCPDIRPSLGQIDAEHSSDQPSLIQVAEHMQGTSLGEPLSSTCAVSSTAASKQRSRPSSWQRRRSARLRAQQEAFAASAGRACIEKHVIQ